MIDLNTIPSYDDSNYADLIGTPNTEDGRPQCLPRRTVYGSPEAESFGLVPVLDFPDLLPDPKDFKEIIAYCHEKEIFSMYHREASTLPKKPNQNGLGHCWNYGIRHALEDLRLTEGQAALKLAPNSLAWLVNWRNQGYYCDETIKAVRDRGIAPADCCKEYDLDPRNFKADWQQRALENRVLEWWDTDGREGVLKMLRQGLAILRTGKPCYIAVDAWGHALEASGMIFDESLPNKVAWVYFNSHADGMIVMRSERMFPSELYAPRASSIIGK